MSRTLYRYDDGDDGSSESWGESPEAYMRRKWLEEHGYLVPVTIDYEAAAAVLAVIDRTDPWDVGGMAWRANEARRVVDAALGTET